MKREFRELLRERGRTELPRVLLAAAECAPLSKTGGLADVVGTLPKALKKLGIDARVITPYHRCIKDKYASQVEHMFYFYTNLGWRHVYVGLERLELDGVVIYLVDNEDYFGDKIYRGGMPEGEQYSFFCRAVMDVIPNLGFEPDVIHCNDWHTAMLPMLGHTQYPGQIQDRAKYLLTIHNIAFQGKFGFDFVQDMLGVDAKYYTPEFMELNGCADFLKAGCVFSDRINTVSPSYASEIKMPYYAEGLEGILNARHDVLTGIINGIDKVTFNPKADPTLPARFDRGHLKGKAACKKSLQEQMGLEQRPDVPLFAMVTRMTEQKGFDLVACVLDDIMSREDMQFMLLGTGDERFEKFMAAAERRYPGRLCAYIGYSETLSHLVYAGSDFFLMPSRFEPCGLSQMIAMRYGSIPIVRETGGLRDTVTPYNRFTGEGNGFSFANFDAWEMRDTMRLALECYRNDEIMHGLIDRAMQADFGFDRSAEDYARHYIWML
ncbi:MAG: glycogen synthase GlgA [Oscillospiraceae bacterium]|nr:glycogen synthase GlgA [Oscillospiraceae bacterium]